MMKYDADISRLVDFLESSPQMGETLIVCHASYESDRANSTFGALLSSSSSPKIAHAILVGTKESMVALQSYRDCFEGLSEKLTKLVGIKPAAIAVSRPNLIDMTRAIHESIGERLTKSIESVIVDASVFSKGPTMDGFRLFQTN